MLTQWQAGGTKWSENERTSIFSKKGGDIVFVGTNEHSVDAKGRVIVPAKYRSELGEGFYIIRDFTGKDCLRVYPKEAWGAFIEKFKNVPMGNLNVQRFIGMIVAGAEAGDIDSQGRMLLKSEFKGQVGIEKNVAIVGNIDHFTIWDVAKWKEFDNETRKMVDENPEIFDMLANLGI